MKKSVERMRKVREAKLRGEDPSSSDSSNSSAGELVWEEDEEIWREYQDVILGHESEADEEGEQVEIAARARKIKEKALKLFTAVDRERDGHVTMDELRSFVLRQKMAHQSRLEEAQMKEGQQPNVGSSPSRWYSRLHSPLHTVNADINDKDEKTKKDSKNNMATPLLQNAAHSVGGYGIESQELHSLAGRNSGPSNAGGKHTGRYSSPSTERRERQRARLQDRQDVLDTDLQRFFNEVDLDNNQVITLDDLERIDFSTYIHSSDERRSKSLLAQAITTADGDTGASKTGMSARAVENKERNNYRESKLNNAGGGGDAGYAQLEGRMDQLESKLDGMSSQIAEIKALFLQMHAKGFK